MAKPTKDQIDAAHQRAENSPTVWFAVLEHARENNDFERAAEARRQLEALGVRITYSRPKGVSRG